MMNPNQEDIDRAVTAAVRRASMRIQNPMARGDRVRTMVSPIDIVKARNKVAIICRIRN